MLTPINQLEERNNTLLQMYGEKAEAVQELTLDLQDMRNLYRTQTQQLMHRLEQAEALGGRGGK